MSIAGDVWMVFVDDSGYVDRKAVPMVVGRVYRALEKDDKFVNIEVSPGRHAWCGRHRFEPLDGDVAVAEETM